MKIFIYMVILVAMLLVPVQRLDVADLEPVEVVAICVNGGQVVLETDTKAQGRGETAEAALMDLQANTAAVVYLDTARYLIVEEDAKDAALALAPWFKPRIKVSSAVPVPLDEAGKYLEVRGDLPCFDSWKNK